MLLCPFRNWARRPVQPVSSSSNKLAEAYSTLHQGSERFRPFLGLGSDKATPVVSEQPAAVMSLDLLLEAALFVERQTQAAEDAHAEQASEPSYTERNGNAAAVAYYSPPASVIQRSGSAATSPPPPPPPSSISGRLAYQNQQQTAQSSQESSRSPSPGPLNGSSSLLHSLSAAAAAVSNGSAHCSSLPVPTRPYQTSPRVIESESYVQQQQQQQQQGYNSSGSHHSFSGSSTTSSSGYRVDDLASRSHRLEEALLRASTKGSLACNPSALSPGPSAPGSSGRTSADELLELKKRTGAGTREVHNKLEKNRRAHLRECFEFLRKQLPANDDKKLSNLGILKNALRYIQTLKRKEREYEHTMERLAREKIAAQQRLAALRKEVSTIPGYGGDGSNPLDLGNVLPVVLQSQHHLAQQQHHLQQQQQQQQQQQLENDRSSPLTIANVQAHTLREENNYRPLVTGQQRRDIDQESNSGTSTASERGEESEHESAPISYLQRHLTARAPDAKTNGQPLNKRPLTTDDAETSSRDAADVKYLQRPAITTSHHTPAATTYLTMVPSATGGVLELADGSGVPGAALYHVRHPYVQLAGPQVLAAHPGVQLLTHSSSLKVLATGPNAPVRVFAADASLQPIMALHAPSVVGGSKQGDDGGLNGTGPQGTVFCTPSGVVIPGLVALPPSTDASNNGQGSGRSSPAIGYEALRTSSASITGSSHYKPSSSSAAAALANSQAVLSLSNGLLKAAVNRSLLPPTAAATAAAAGVTHVMTPITVTRSLPLVANMAVMGQPAKHVAHILANPSIPSLDKMGLIKPGSIPIIGSPYLNAQAGGRHVIKPVVVMAAPPQSTSPSVTHGRDGSAQSAAPSRAPSP